MNRLRSALNDFDSSWARFGYRECNLFLCTHKGGTGGHTKIRVNRLSMAGQFRESSHTSPDDSKRGHFDVIEIATIVTHIIDLSLQGLYYGVREVHVFELLSAAKPARTEHIDFH